MTVTENKLAIIELMHAYILSIDSHDNQLFADHFTEDGVYQSPWGTAIGKTAIIGTIDYWHSSGITDGKRHFVGSILIKQLQDSEALVESSYWVASAKETPSIVATGFYEDILRKENGQWKIANCKQTVDPSFKMNS